MRYGLAAVCGVLATALLLTFGGCGGGDQPVSKAAGDTSKPLEGKSASKASQLEGTWMAVTEGPYAGFEFMDDQQVLVNTGFSAGQMTLKYDVLDGGRLSLIAPSGQTQVFSTSMSGDLLELGEPGSPKESQRFKRVPKGKPLAEALKEYHQQLAAEREKRLAEIAAALSRKDLVIRPTGDAGNAPPFVLELAVNSSALSGRAILDLEDPMIFDVQGSIRMDQYGAADVNLQMNQRAPQGVQPKHARATFKVPNDGKAPTLVGSISDVGEVPAEIVVDAAATKKANDHLAAVAEQIKQAIAAVTDPLGVKALLTSSVTMRGSEAPMPVTITLRRLGDQPAFAGVAEFANNTSAPAQASVRVINKRGLLEVDLTNGHHWRVGPGEGKFAGTWFFGNSPLSGQGAGNSELIIQRMWTAEQMAARQAAVEKFVKTDLQTPHTWLGEITLNNQGPTPAWMQLQVGADGSATGQAFYPLLEGSAELAGQIVPGVEGPGLQLQAVKVTGTPGYVRSFGRQQFKLEVDDPEAAAVGLAGDWNGGMARGPIALGAFDESSVEADRKKVTAALADATFTLTNSREVTNPDRKPAFLRLKVDAATHKVFGELGGETRVGSLRIPCIFEGEMTTDHGIHILRIKQIAALGYVSDPGFSGLVLRARLDDQGAVALSGLHILNGNFNAGAVTLTPATEPMVVPQDQKIMLAALRLGAVQHPPSKAQPGDSAVLLVTGTTRGRIYGTGPYSNSSPIGTAAIHAGLIADNEQALIRVTYAAPLVDYPAGEANGITATAYSFGKRAPTGLSYTMQKLPIE